MLKKFKKLQRIRSFGAPKERVTATIEQSNHGCVLNLGHREVILDVHSFAALRHDVFDFAVFAMAAISMSQNIEIDAHFPVSESVAERLPEIKKVFGLWSVDTLAPLRLNLRNVVPSPSSVQAREIGIICLSGGLDSMSAAISAVAQGGASHALLIAGADYKTSKDIGFIELKERVLSIASRLGLELVVVETNIRKVGIEWGMTHGLNLGFCLNYLSPIFEKGLFAQDFTAFQDGFVAPWGNFNALPTLLSTETFPIKTLGIDVDRVEKLRRVQQFDEQLLDDLTVCYADKKIGGNCGRCTKCTVTRAAFYAHGISDEHRFNQRADLVSALGKLKKPKNFSQARVQMVRNSELLAVLKDGAVKDAVNQYDARVRAVYHRQAPGIG